MKQLFIVVLLFNGFFVQSQTAQEIVKKADDKFRGTTSIVELSITTTRPTWRRTLELKAWTKGRDYTMILLKSPVKEKGITFLKRKKEVWNWIPILERTIKLPPSMMSQSWMGTDFTNDDLVRESSIIHDYTHTFQSDTIINNKTCYRILLLPKPEASVIWGKIITCIDKQDFIEVHSKFYDEEGILVNILNAYDAKLMDGRYIPTRFELIPLDKKGQKTEMTYQKIQYNIPIDDAFFTTEQMKSIP